MSIIYRYFYFDYHYIFIIVINNYFVRYVVCFNKLETRPAVTDYLFEVNGILNNTKKGVTVTQVVDPKDMDDEFVEYITKSNTEYVVHFFNLLLLLIY